MSEPLSKHVFSASDLPDVQDFHCGDQPYEQEVADWLKGNDVDCAVNSIAHATKPSRVWLYKTGEKIVGFGASPRASGVGLERTTMGSCPSR